ncbi:MAG: RIP metalloprotease RseP [Vicingaceae bacterium]
MEYVIQFGQLFLSISILVVLHEGGHFVAAKYFNTKVESFYLFFNPWFSIYKKKIGETEYGIGWLPLGGYVKIAGMIDESMDKEQMEKDPEPWEFRSKPAWQRLIIMLGGIIVNVIVGFLIYSFVLMGYGEKYLPNENLTDGVYVMNDVLSEDVGIQTGDKIISINGENYQSFSNTVENMLLAETITVNRNGEQLKLAIPVDVLGRLIESKKRGQGLLFPRIPFTVAGIRPGYVAENSDLKLKDQIIGINNDDVKYYDEFKTLVKKYSNQNVEIKVLRDGETVVIPMLIPDSNIIGVAPYFYSIEEMDEHGVYNTKTVKYGFFSAFGRGAQKAQEEVVKYYNGFKKMVNPSTGAYKGMGGFYSISKVFGTKWRWQNFWEKTAWISLVLAFMNLLPIPALDGGHVMFLLYEIITGRKPHEKLMEYAQIAGMIILLLFMVYANTDFLRI